MKVMSIPALLSFHGGFLDTVGFLGLQGLFTAHVTGNFVTLGAAVVFGTHGVIAKLIALPEFIIVVALARFAGAALRKRDLDALRPLPVAKVIFLLAFFIAGVALGPFPDDTECGAARPLRQRSADNADDRKHHSGRARRGRPDARRANAGPSRCERTAQPDPPWHCLVCRGLCHRGFSV
jgi:hypothetical protein